MNQTLIPSALSHLRPGFSPNFPGVLWLALVFLTGLDRDVAAVDIVPHLVRFEARLEVDGRPFHGPGLFKFALTSPGRTDFVWHNARSTGGVDEPELSIPLEVADGTYSVLLGDPTIPGMAYLPSKVFTNANLRLRVWFSTDSIHFKALLPDEPFLPTVYAWTAMQVAPGGVDSMALADGAITSAKLARGAALRNLASADLLLLSENPRDPGLGFMKQVGSVEVAGEQWTSKFFETPTESHHHTALWTGSEMLVFAQSLSPFSTSPKHGLRYSPATDTWKLVSRTDAFPSLNPSSLIVWTGKEALVWSPTGREGRAYDPAMDRWRTISTLNAPSPREFPSSAWTGSEWIVWGGADPTAGFGSPIANGARYDPATDTWKPIIHPQARRPSGRSQAKAIWAGDRMVLAGGVSGTGATLEELWAYVPQTDTWTRMPSPQQVSVQSPFLFHTGTELLLFNTNSPTRTLDGARYNLSKDTWSRLPSRDVSGIIPLFTAVWNGWEAVFFGGLANTTNPASFARGGFAFNPDTNGWRDLPTVDAPSPRVYHSAVSAGNEILIWGGLGESSALNDGGRFDRQGNRWIPILERPLLRDLPHVAWTGNTMLVWGGSEVGSGGSSRPKAGGHRYDTARGRWKPMSELGAPAAKLGSSAVWTGAELIVWGGDRPAPTIQGAVPAGATASAPQGARYDPVRNMWSPLPSAGNEPPRAYHRAVWTGSEMIVFGGFSVPDSGGDSQHTGMAYSPASNRWRPIQRVPVEWTRANPARHQRSAVWTGREMMVLGGSAADLARAWFYEPESNSWRSTVIPSAYTSKSAAVPSLLSLGEKVAVYYESALSILIFDPQRDAWSKIYPTANARRPVVWTGRELVVEGGQAYDPDDDTWRSLPRDVPGPISPFLNMLMAGDKLLAWPRGISGGSMSRAISTLSPTHTAYLFRGASGD